jgi:DNA-directed RNA polymerase subunit RPC12/RpoP
MKNSERTSNYVCFTCGRKYLTEKQKNDEHISTFHLGKCGVCNLEKPVTSIRNYNYLIKPEKNEDNKGNIGQTNS